MANPLRGLLISTFNLGNCAALLENDESAPLVEVTEAPFGQVQSALATFAGAPAGPESPDFLLVWSQPERLFPAFQRAADHEAVSAEEVLAEVEDLAGLILQAAARVKYVFVPTWILESAQRGRGFLDWHPQGGLSLLLARMNVRLAEKLASAGNVYVLDSARWQASAGAGAASPKLWYQAKVPFAPAVFQAAVQDLKAALQGLLGQARKLVVVDLDNTLWGGIVGDAGWENLRVGGHDPLGEAFVDFQKALLALTRRGVVLALASKNDEAVALEALRSHPEMVLRPDHFAAWRINWQDKAQNIIDLAAELNLGLQSIVFLDDNPVERGRVRDALPEVLVPEWPESPMLYRAALQQLRCFDTATVSAEDAARTEAYVSERKRTELRQQAGSVTDWLRSLQIQVTVEPLTPGNLARATQLLNKTNQLNLRTRRLSEKELAAWVQPPDQSFWTFRVADKYGDAGLTGLVSFSRRGDTAFVEDYILSCRVMGRQVEETLVHWLVAQARAAGLREVVAELLPTAKNKPCLEFWQRSGFTVAETVFRWDATKEYPRPDVVTLLTPPPA